MEILVLGGTSFVGRAIVEEALSRGDSLTLYSRGRTGTDLFPDVPRLVGDRETGDYAALGGRSWDAVVDVSAYVPRHVAQAADVLAGSTGRYLLISTGSVYDWSSTDGAPDESAPRLPAERGTEEVTGRTYGPLKVACEDEALSRYGDRATIVRPGIVAGPHDPTDRFTWWARRAARGGTVALPARPDQPVQVVDSRDLARLVVSLLHDDRAGTYNAVGPAEPVTMSGLVEACARGTGATVDVVPVDPALGEGVPLVLPEAVDVMMRRSADLARTVGLTATLLEQTAADVVAWDRERGEPPLSVDLPAEREEALRAAAQR
ncbi:NAD-dependent epimerase/dehydratase family protein [Blastococcus sp. CCUG 61487]|uniref:NAD-dependent epimerase/dehydratase family protein n=1 Tax=Blastococcus sp. CCUG 61487 TaxID=1840703 RepID=UPI0010C081F1|nr:NAD-dependent epimerase/dehydratase family protein [Blastococcus sp. CCUG 61487]TKJ29745.1 epimerase [Blastococcus sp. CCUG 61487]